MVALPEEELTEPRGGRGLSFSSVAEAIGLKGVLSGLKQSGFGNVARVRTSPLARRIITFNLIALCILLVGMLYLDQFRGGLVLEKQSSMLVESELYADVIEARLLDERTRGSALLGGLPVSEGLIARLYDPTFAVQARIDAVSYTHLTLPTTSRV